MYVVDNETGFKEEILKIYLNSKLITQTKITKKGIDCVQWFDTTTKYYEQRFTEL